MWDDFFFYLLFILDFFSLANSFAKIFVEIDLFERHGTDSERGTDYLIRFFLFRTILQPFLTSGVEKPNFPSNFQPFSSILQPSSRTSGSILYHLPEVSTAPYPISAAASGGGHGQQPETPESRIFPSNPAKANPPPPCSFCAMIPLALSLWNPPPPRTSSRAGWTQNKGGPAKKSPLFAKRQKFLFLSKLIQIFVWSLLQFLLLLRSTVGHRKNPLDYPPFSAGH